MEDTLFFFLSPHSLNFLFFLPSVPFSPTSTLSHPSFISEMNKLQHQHSHEPTIQLLPNPQPIGIPMLETHIKSDHTKPIIHRNSNSPQPRFSQKKKKKGHWLPINHPQCLTHSFNHYLLTPEEPDPYQKTQPQCQTKQPHLYSLALPQARRRTLSRVPPLNRASTLPATKPTTTLIPTAIVSCIASQFLVFLEIILIQSIIAASPNLCMFGE